MIDFQSSATALRPCPSGTFDNSQQHARVIYGWVHRPKPTLSPEGTAEIHVSRFAVPEPASVSPCQVSLPRIPKVSGVPRFSKVLPGYSKPCQVRVPSPSKAVTGLFQVFPKYSKPFQGFFRKKNCLFFLKICSLSLQLSTFTTSYVVQPLTISDLLGPIRAPPPSRGIARGASRSLAARGTNQPKSTRAAQKATQKQTEADRKRIIPVQCSSRTCPISLKPPANFADLIDSVVSPENILP
jgi:hypothetical protein